MSLRCGRIRYTNALPVYAAFDAGAAVYPGSLHADVPSRLNAMLLSGELDLSPVSAFAWARDYERFVLLPDLCIGARDEVVSVILVSSTPPALLDGATVYVTPESESGRSLLRVLLERRYGVTPDYAVDAQAAARARAGEPALLIGDAAIDALESVQPERVYDLGKLWHDWTGRQTVFAVWAARREVYARDPDGVRACLEALTDAYAWSHSHGDAVVALAQRAHPRPRGFYETYYGKLNFAFHAAARRGLSEFCRELRELGAIAALPPVTPEVLGAVAR